MGARPVPLEKEGAMKEETGNVLGSMIAKFLHIMLRNTDYLMQPIGSHCTYFR